MRAAQISGAASSRGARGHDTCCSGDTSRHQSAESGKGCLSQWWPAAFTVNGLVYASAEHFMMAGKALLFGDAETAGRIREAPHPGAAKALGRQVRGFSEQLWAERRFDLVLTGNLAKFGQHPDLPSSCSVPVTGCSSRRLRETGPGYRARCR